MGLPSLSEEVARILDPSLALGRARDEKKEQKRSISSGEMEAVKNARLFVPALPTLWPGMLFGRGAPSSFMPFSAPNVRWFYFARNAVWLTVKMLGLDKGEVLMPAYHHGVEVEAVADAGATPRFYRVGSRWDVDVEDVDAFCPLRRTWEPRAGTRERYDALFAQFVESFDRTQPIFEALNP